MFKKEFETWPTYPKIKETQVKHDLHISILGYLKNKPFCFVELSNNGNEKNMQMIGLNNAVAIPNNNWQLNPLV